MKASWGLGGDRDTTVRFDYDGVIPSDSLTSLSDPAIHPISVRAVDTDGDVGYTSFGLTEISPHHITTLDEHRDKVHLFKQYTNDTVTSRFNVDGHGVHSVAFSPVDATLLATGSWDGTVKLWDVVTERDIATLRVHTAGITSVAFSPIDATLLATGSKDWTVKLWDVETERNIATLKEHTDAVTSVAFSSDGSTLATGSWDRTVKLWDVATRQNIATLKEHTDAVNSVAFSSDGSTLAAGLWDRTVKLWDVATRQNIATLKGHTGPVNSVAFSSDGSTLATTGLWDRTVKLWNIATLVNFVTLGHGNPVRSVAFSSDDTTLASGTEAGTVELWDTSMLMGVRLEATAEIDIPDPNLRAAIAEAIGLPPNTPILRGHLQALTDLEARNANISNLTGLEGATSLRTLDLRGNSVSDFSPLTDLTNLRSLFLVDNNISDISTMSGLNSLARLNLGNNNISDISAVAGLTNLASLNLQYNNISDISALAGLTKLTLLYLSGNNISDISAVSGLTNLPLLDLWYNNISDISAVSGLTKLRWLNLGGNSVSDISAVSGLTNLTGLNLVNNNVSDISVVVRLTQLTWLNLSNNAISDVSPLLGLNLTGIWWDRTAGLYLEGNPLSYPSINTHIPAMQAKWVEVKFDNRAHPALLKISGDNQKGAAFAPLSQPFLVEAQDENGFALVGISVMFAVTRGDGTLGVTSTTTDANGRAQSTLILGPNLGANTVEVSAAGIESPATFYAIADSELPPMRADVNHDGLVNVLDLIVIASSLGQSGQHDGDVNGDRVVSILDLVLAAGVFEETAAAPSAQPQVPETLTAVEVHGWLTNARSLEPKDPIMKRGFAVLEQLLVSLTPKETELLANYPNPFNPETWIPYRLAEDAFVTLTIYDGSGRVVRTLNVGHRIAAVYENRSKAIYWNGRNGLGEQVASGVYFYHLSAGDYSATRKMLILK